MVEMTLITPFLLLLSAGVFEFSNILHTRLLMQAGVEDAARYISRCSNDPTGTNWATCVSNAKNLALNGQILGGTARVTGWTQVDVTPDPCVATTDADGVEQYRSNLACVYSVNVEGTLAYTGTGLWNVLGFHALDIVVSHEERLIGW